MKQFSIIVAFDSEYGIGREGRLPWDLPLDLKHFKEITTAVLDPLKKNAVIMGRKTWESLPFKFRPLPKRLNIVLSKMPILGLPSEVISSQSLDNALDQLSALKSIENIFVIGGAQIYTQALEHSCCQKLFVTHVKGAHACDVFFPPISKQFFPISSSEENQDGSIYFHFAEYLRFP